MFVKALLLAGGVCAVQTVAAARIEVFLDSPDGLQPNIELLVDGKPVCSIKKAAQSNAEQRKQVVCGFELPADARGLTVRGDYNVADARGQRVRHQGEYTVALLDFAPVGGKLAQPGKSFGERAADFVVASRAFAKQHAPEHILDIEPGQRPDAVGVQQAEKRLGYALPPDYVSLQLKNGAIRIGDHGFARIADAADAITQLKKDWGYDEAGLAELSPERRDSFKASTLLFTEVGDGLGGLFYRPPPTRNCGDKGLYYWWAQEYSGKRLKNADGSCMDFAAAFRWVMDSFVVDDLARTLGESTPVRLLIDRSAMPPLHLRLGDGDKFDVDLRGYWSTLND